MSTAVGNHLVFFKVELEKLLSGSEKTTGHVGSVRLKSFPNICISNPENSSRSERRRTLNPELEPITLVYGLCGAVPQAMQVMTLGQNLGVLTISEVISDGENVQLHREVILKEVYITNWSIMLVEEGLVCSIVVEYGSIEQSRVSYDQALVAQGKTSMSASQILQTTTV
ncbi:MAG: hypothetical protein HOI80_01015 [Alphaproteobacteria bacterium]|jgi:hypothetical protein|nr:hypothetical protein [Alphaproteobacteria bacterium]MBT5390660.1 hypothetical protein [Alphaproteobacteria bacterium]MBT5540975.1 hypothetical protein [Alphaproteobacteria bacterium]MBT5654068.1 hypothetical protein [Alphaproteobacteria bacterium]